MRYLIFLILLLFPNLSSAQDWEEQTLFNDTADGPFLRIISSTDTAIFAPLIDDFLEKNPDFRIEYLTTGTADVDRRFRASPDTFDLVISSAMDLQLKLANDGFAATLRNVEHPSWAQWRQSLFAFTTEPAAIVLNRAAFDGHGIPKTRQELIQALRERPEEFRQRVGTYDVRQSGAGYLLATQDARASETFWRLMEVMGGLDVQLYCCSSNMIDDLASGKIAVAYNVLGNYAAGRSEHQDKIEIVLPSDFPTTMMRTALVSKSAQEPEAAQTFVEHLIALQSGPGGGSVSLPALTQQDTGAAPSTIALEPALMTFLDALKRKKFLQEWEDAVIQE